MRRRLMRIAALAVLTILLPISGHAVASSSVPGCSAVRGPALAYALDGSVYRASVGGLTSCRLTGNVHATAPLLSPGGKRVAFIAGTTAANTVHVLRVASGPGSGKVIRDRSRFHGMMTWSPDGQYLAFLAGETVRVWSVACGCTLSTVFGRANQPPASFAWSRDSRRLVTYVAPPDNGVMTRIDLHVTTVSTGRRATVPVQFPAWLKGTHAYAGSYPFSVVAWLPHDRLLLTTAGYGIGLGITGIWSVPASGGMARLEVGTHRGGSLALTYPLLNASEVRMSVNQKRLLLDPIPGFWVAPSSGGQGIRFHVPVAPCMVTQAEWVGNGHVAYVAACTPGGRLSILARLYLLSTRTGQSVLVRALRSNDQTALSIALATRCLHCGAG